MIKLLLPAAIFLMMVSIGTSFRTAEMWLNLRRMGLWAWIRLLLVVFVVPPALALALARLLPLTVEETVGLFLIGVAPGAPLLTRNVAKRGFDAQLAAVYQVWVALLTPLMVPLLVFAAARLYDRDVWISPTVLLKEVAEKQFLPLLAGMLMMYFAPRFADRARPVLNAIGNTILFGVMALLLFKTRAQLAQITPWVAFAALVLAAGSMLLVPWIMRTDPVRDQTLSVCNANRHVGLALLLSGEYLHRTNTLPTVACYAVVAPLVMWAYSRRFARRQELSANTEAA